MTLYLEGTRGEDGESGAIILLEHGDQCVIHLGRIRCRRFFIQALKCYDWSQNYEMNSENRVGYVSIGFAINSNLY
jgi:hypothetical protein